MKPELQENKSVCPRCGKPWDGSDVARAEAEMQEGREMYDALRNMKAGRTQEPWVVFRWLGRLKERRQW